MSNGALHGDYVMSRLIYVFVKENNKPYKLYSKTTAYKTCKEAVAAAQVKRPDGKFWACFINT